MRRIPVMFALGLGVIHHSFAADPPQDKSGSWLTHESSTKWTIQSCSDAKTTCIAAASCTAFFGAMTAATLGVYNVMPIPAAMLVGCSTVLGGTRDFCKAHCEAQGKHSAPSPSLSPAPSPSSPVGGSIVGSGDAGSLIATALASAGTSISHLQKMEGGSGTLKPVDVFLSADRVDAAAIAGSVGSPSPEGQRLRPSQSQHSGGGGLGSGGGGGSAGGSNLGGWTPGVLPSASSSGDARLPSEEASSLSDGFQSGSGGFGLGGASPRGSEFESIAAKGPSSLTFGTTGGGADVAPLLTPDPEDYFTRVAQDESLFKIVHQRYQAKAHTWEKDDASKVSSPKK